MENPSPLRPAIRLVEYAGPPAVAEHSGVLTEKSNSGVARDIIAARDSRHVNVESISLDVLSLNRDNTLLAL